MEAYPAHGELWQIDRFAAGIINDCQFGEANDYVLRPEDFSRITLFKCYDLLFLLAIIQTAVHIQHEISS